MVDFSHLDALRVKDKTADLTLHAVVQVDGSSPTLVLAPATEDNKPYFNAVLKRSRASLRQIKSGAINQDLLADNRNEDRVLFPALIVRGWRNMTDAKGKLVEFNQQNCRDFLTALPDWVFDMVRDFAGTPASFVADDAPVIDAKDTGKN